MGTSEILDQSAVCPCGQGEVRRAIDSPNYVFGRPTISEATVICPVCRPDWEVSPDQSQLFHHERALWPGKAALAESRKLRSEMVAEIHGYQERALLQHLHCTGANSKAAQHRQLTKDKLYSGSYQTFLRGGFKVAVAAFDPKKISECSSALKQLDGISRAIDELQVAHQSWLGERRHRHEFQLIWKFV